jgi:hypothetical protein
MASVSASGTMQLSAAAAWHQAAKISALMKMAASAAAIVMKQRNENVSEMAKEKYRNESREKRHENDGEISGM